MANATPPALFSPQHQAALEADLSLWRLTLRRHEAGHGRTRYHRHMTMALQCWDRFSIDQLSANWTHFVGVVWTEWRERQEVCQVDMERRRKREATFWKIRPKNETPPSANNDASLELDRQGVQAILDDLIRRTTTGWKEVESRLSYAVQSIIPEISRGFFLPLLTVALGAMARVRVLFLRWRMDLVSNRLPEMLSQSLNVKDGPMLGSLSVFCSDLRHDRQDNFKKSTRHDKQSIMSAALGISSPRIMTGHPKKVCAKQANVATDLAGAHSDSQAIQADENVIEDMGETMVAPDVTEVDHNRQIVASIQQKGKSKKKRKMEKPKKQKRKDKKVKRGSDFFDSLFERR